MEKQVIALLIPIFALAIPLAAIIFHGLQKVARMRLEETRVRAGALDPASEAEIAALRDEVGEVRRELGEVQERLDFAERLLSQAGEAGRLPGRRENVAGD
jgi:hypothetical protein